MMETTTLSLELLRQEYRGRSDYLDYLIEGLSSSNSPEKIEDLRRLIAAEFRRLTWLYNQKGGNDVEQPTGGSDRT